MTVTPNSKTTIFELLTVLRMVKITCFTFAKLGELPVTHRLQYLPIPTSIAIDVSELQSMNCRGHKVDSI